MTVPSGRPANAGAMATARRCQHEAALLRDTAIETILTDTQRTLLMRKAEMSERLARRCAFQTDKSSVLRSACREHYLRLRE